jgi:hypothetical protein
MVAYSALAGALHDGAEAYIQDVNSPLKGQPFMSAYRVTEMSILRAIYQSVGMNVSYLYDGRWQEADRLIGAHEGVVLMDHTPADMGLASVDETLCRQILAKRTKRDVEQELTEYVHGKLEDIARFTTKAAV